VARTLRRRPGEEKGGIGETDEKTMALVDDGPEKRDGTGRVVAYNSILHHGDKTGIKTEPPTIAEFGCTR